MKVNLAPAEVEAIIAKVSADYEGNLIANRLDDESNSRTRWANFTLRVVSSRGPGHKVSLSALAFGGHKRRLVAACWHAHRDVMRELFRQYPDAKLRSAMASYDGAADFDCKYRATGYVNIGSMMYPVRADESCDCALEGRLLSEDLPYR